MKFRKKPVVIEAIQFKDTSDSASEIMEFARDKTVIWHIHSHCMTIPTLEGDMTASDGDWIIRGVSGEIYPCKPDIFEKTYEEVAISKTETTSARALSCWYCTEIEKHGVVAVKTVLDKTGRKLDAYETPYNYCPACGRKLKED